MVENPGMLNKSIVIDHTNKLFFSNKKIISPVLFPWPHRSCSMGDWNLDTIEGINEFAHQVAVQQTAKEIQWCVNAVHHHYAGDNGGRDAYFTYINQKCQEIIDEQPTVIFKE